VTNVTIDAMTHLDEFEVSLCMVNQLYLSLDNFVMNVTNNAVCQYNLPFSCQYNLPFSIHIDVLAATIFYITVQQSLGTKLLFRIEVHISFLWWVERNICQIFASIFKGSSFVDV
jgi:hypothetical protein